VHGREELSKCEAGDWMLMRVPDEERQVFDDLSLSKFVDNWHVILSLAPLLAERPSSRASFPGSYSEHVKGGLKKGGPSGFHYMVEHICMPTVGKEGYLIRVSQK